jgi:hypothetical protein
MKTICWFFVDKNCQDSHIFEQQVLAHQLSAIVGAAAMVCFTLLLGHFVVLNLRPGCAVKLASWFRDALENWTRGIKSLLAWLGLRRENSTAVKARRHEVERKAAGWTDYYDPGIAYFAVIIGLYAISAFWHWQIAKDEADFDPDF